MANKKQVETLKQNVETWNRWRRQNLKEEVDLRGVDLREANLSYADLSLANLSTATIIGANLSETNLSGANDAIPMVV